MGRQIKKREREHCWQRPYFRKVLSILEEGSKITGTGKETNLLWNRQIEIIYDFMSQGRGF